MGDLAQDCSNSSALALELLQSCTKPSKYSYVIKCWFWFQYGLQYQILLKSYLLYFNNTYIDDIFVLVFNLVLLK